MALGIKPTVDFAFKKIFGSPENVGALIGLLNAILELRAPIADVEILNPFSYQEFEEDKQIVLDIRARDSTGRMLNIEMQVSVVSGLAQRLVYYACSLYVDQLEAGGPYVSLRPAISICLLSDVLFKDSDVPHHRLRDLLPGVEFDQAITVIETISQKTEDRTMYNQREKALRDHQWLMEGAREEGREEGKIIGTISTLQGILGETVMEENALEKLGHDELNRLCADLQHRLRMRGSS